MGRHTAHRKGFASKLAASTVAVGAAGLLGSGAVLVMRRRQAS